MSRNERENVDHLDLPDPVQTNGVYITENGISINRDEWLMLDEDKRPSVCAKEIQHLDTGTTTYFILGTGSGMLYDPRETDRRYFIRNIWKFVRASKTTYDLYIKFLEQKYTSLLSQAQRRL